MESIAIYRTYEGKEIKVADVLLGSGCIYSNNLMQDEFVQLTFNHNSASLLEISDHVTYNGVVYTIGELTPPARITGGYKYEQKFSAPWVLWKKRRLMFDYNRNSIELGWKMTQFPQYYLELICNTLSAQGFGNYSYQTDDEFKQMMSCDFSTSTDIISALNTMADNSHWSTEWWVDEVNKVIHFGICELSTTTYPIVELNDGVEVSAVSRNQGQKSNKTTRLYAFGSTRNISPYYRRDLVFTAGDQEALYFAQNVAEEAGYDYGIMDSHRGITSECFDFNVKKSTEDAKVSLTFNNKNIAESKDEDNDFELVSDEFFENVGRYPRTIKFTDGEIEGYFYNDNGSTPSRTRTLSVYFTIYNDDGSEVGTLEKSVSVDGVKSTINISLANESIKTYNISGKFYMVIQATFNGDQNHILTCKNIKLSVSGLQEVSRTQITIGNKTLDCVVNPLGVSVYDEQNGVICYNGTIVPRVGMQYTLSNIVNTCLPSSYFTDTNKAVAADVAEARLMLPEGTNYIDAKENMTQEEIVEGMLIFEDIYPRQKNSIDEVFTSQYKNTIDISGATETWNAYNIVDKDFHFSKKYVIDGETLKLTFQTGLLAGMTFEVIYHNDENRDDTNSMCSWFEIVRNEDYGMKIPNDTYKPVVGDQYILFGFDTQYVDDHLVSEAENELLREAKKVIKELPKDQSTYECTMNMVMCSDMDLKLGQRVTFKSNRYGEYDSRVRAIEKQISGATLKYSIGAHVRYSRYNEFLNLLNQGKAAQLIVRGSGNAMEGATIVRTEYGAWNYKANVSAESIAPEGGIITYNGMAERTEKKIWSNGVETYSGGKNNLTWSSNVEGCTFLNGYLTIPANNSVTPRTITITASYGTWSKTFDITQDAYHAVSVYQMMGAAPAAGTTNLHMAKFTMLGYCSQVSYRIEGDRDIGFLQVTQTGTKEYTLGGQISENYTGKTRVVSVYVSNGVGDGAVIKIIQPPMNIEFYHGCTDSVPPIHNTSTYKNITANYPYTIETKRGNKCVWFSIPEAFTIRSWINNVDTNEDLIQQDEIEITDDESIEGNKLYVYKANINIGTTYTIIIDYNG